MRYFILCLAIVKGNATKQLVTNETTAYIYAVKQRRQIVSFVLLLAYLFVLATSLVPHHHHIYHSCCSSSMTANHSNNDGIIIVDCFSEHKDHRGCPQKSSKCDDIQCISRVVYIHNQILKQVKGDSDQPLLPFLFTPYTAGILSESIAASYAQQQPTRVEYDNRKQEPSQLLLTSGLGLRAPPTHSLRG